METPEKKSEFAKRVLFGASKATAAGNCAASERPAGSRSGSQSSTSSAPGHSIYSLPGTPRTTNGGPNTTTPYMLRTQGKSATSNNAALSVFLRVRPPGVPGADVDKLTGRRTYQILEDQATLRTFPPVSAGHSRTINRQAKDFGFTRVLSPSAGQTETYESTMKPLVDDVFASHNALLFAYGMTNAGKTYTVLGEDGSPGLIPQALNDTFERVARIAADGNGEEVHVEMSFLEIYIENVYDLLAAASPDDWAKARSALKLDDRMGVISARDLSKHVITSAADGLDLVRRATSNRRVASTRLNEDSSRSHSVCMIKIIREKGKDSSLWVVDLAGSERIGRTGAGASSTRQKEANNINKSLSTLWHCLTIMRANLRKDEPETRVPFRESKLTHLFKNHLQGPNAGKTVMVININPSTADFDETQQVLKNSTIAREVRTVKDDSAANRQNGLIHTPYGFNGRKMVVKKPQASRRSIHQAVAPKLDGLDPPPPGETSTQPPKRASHSQGDTDCGSDGGNEDEGDGDGGGGYLSGAESDSGLVDTRQSMNLVVRNLQVDNAALKTKLKTTLADRQKEESTRGHQPMQGGPLEQYIVILEERVTSAEARMEEMRQDHREEVQDLENEFESFLEENGLTGEGGDPCKPSPAVIERLQEEVRVANLQADQWKREAETLRARLQKETSGSPSTRSPLRQSFGSTSQTGRSSLENRQDGGENNPPGPAPGGVGSPSKNATRNSSSSPKMKASSLPSKKKKMSSQVVAPGAEEVEEEAAAPVAKVTMSTAAAARSENSSSNVGKDSSAVETAAGGSAAKERHAGGVGKAPGATDPRDSKESSGCWGAKGKVVVAVSRRVSVLRVSNAGGRRVSAVRASLANGRRASRASYAAGSRRVSHLTRSRSSVANAKGARGESGGGSAGDNVSGNTSGNTSGSTSPSGNGAKGSTTATPVVPEGDDGEYSADYPIGMGSRRESALSMEENFFEKARRCVLRAIGVGSKTSSSRPGSINHGGSYSPAVAETAEEIELRHKIKVKMPKRPSKKAMDAVVDPLWAVENQATEVFEEEEEEVEDVEEMDEVEEVSTAQRTSSSAVMSGIERWVFGGKQELRSTPKKSPNRNHADGASGTAEVSPVPGTTTMHDYVRAM